MKRLADGVAVLLLAVLLSACGSQPEQAYGGQTESLKPTGQAEASQPEAEESVGESAEQNSSGNEKTVENNFADGEDTDRREAVLWQKRIHLTLKRKRSR